jgi:hypothetical protein
MCLTDFIATCADLLGLKLPDGMAEDSVSMLPAMLGQTTSPLRTDPSPKTEPRNVRVGVGKEYSSDFNRSLDSAC